MLMSILDVDDAREPSHLASEADLAISNAVWPARSRTGHITAAYRRTHSFRDAIQNHLRSGGWHIANAPDRPIRKQRAASTHRIRSKTMRWSGFGRIGCQMTETGVDHAASIHEEASLDGVNINEADGQCPMRILSIESTVDDASSHPPSVPGCLCYEKKLSY